MTVLKRVLSGSAAAWVKILITMVTQIALVPIFLTYWTVEQYGCWLLIQAISGFSTIFSLGHQDYIGFEFLKIGDKNPQRLSEVFYSSIPYAIVISLLELTVILIIIAIGLGNELFDPKHNLDKNLLWEALISLIVYSLAWLISTSVSGLAGRLLTTFGYFSRVSWWGVLMSVLTAIASVLLVTLGAGLLQTVIALAILYIIVSIPIHLDLWKLCKKYKLNPQKLNWSLGFHNSVKSTAVSVTGLLDFFRQQGMRLFLSASVGVSELTAFATMRTLSNVSLQGIGTITNPVVPEFMSFLRERNQDKTTAIYGFLWFITVILLSPVLVIIQGIIPEIFNIWTRGKIVYDPIVFGLFSVTLLIFALSRVPLMVLQGNNLLRKQLNIALVVGVITVVGILLVAPIYGIAGAALVLLVAEIAGCIYSLIFASKWMNENGLSFPFHLLSICLVCIVLTSLGIYFFAIYPLAKLTILSCTLLSNFIIVVVFVKKLPKFVTLKIVNTFRKKQLI
jgi:O-antigen/teichoic acid export membrane protein